MEHQKCDDDRQDAVTDGFGARCVRTRNFLVPAPGHERLHSVLVPLRRTPSAWWSGRQDGLVLGWTAVAGPDESGPLGYGWQFITPYQALPTAQREGARMNTLMDRDGPEERCIVRMRENVVPFLGSGAHRRQVPGVRRC